MPGQPNDRRSAPPLPLRGTLAGRAPLHDGRLFLPGAKRPAEANDKIRNRILRELNFITKTNCYVSTYNQDLTDVNCEM